MEKKNNIAEILQDKPKGIRLYSPIFGECAFCYVREDTNDICVKKHNGVIEYFNSEGLYFALGEVMLFPSREMHDWFKLDWKRGDALSCGVDNLCIFEKWANKEYTEFYAKFVTPNYSGNTFKTEKWSKETNEAVIKQYISNIEEFKGGKLNLTTLEIEKAQPEFKDGDIVVYKCEIDNVPSTIFIFRGISQRTPYYSYYASLDSDGFLSYKLGGFGIYKRELRLATEEEKKQLFSDLANNELFKNLWHPASEVPEIGRVIIMENHYPDSRIEFPSRMRKSTSHNPIDGETQKWFYINNLLPKEGGNQ